MFVTRKHLERRTFLRGMGAAIALPMLDAMIPAFAAPAKAAQAPVRTSFVYVPNGIVMDMDAQDRGQSLRDHPYSPTPGAVSRSHAGDLRPDG